MTNLVKRLREYCDGNNDLMDAAANRIDKLEVALRYIQEKAFADRDDPAQLYILYQNDYVDLNSYIDEVMKEELSND